MIYLQNKSLRTSAVLKQILLLLLFMFAFKTDYAQFYSEDSTNVYESLSDSSNLTSGYFDANDALRSLFISSDSTYTSIKAFSSDSLTKAYDGDWSNDELFLSSKDFDPSKMEDSIRVVLQDNAGHCFYMPRQGIITSGFGWRRWQFHYGVDVGLHTGDTVRAAFDGIVRVSKFQWSWGFGNVIVIRHQNGLETLYGHLSASKVVPNQAVKAGDIIGFGGSTGRSTGPHLHFEIRYKGTPINPNILIDLNTFSLKKDTVYISKKTFGYYTDVKKVVANARYYTIRNGDTLSKIALYYGTSVASICNLNGISPATLLNVGRTLRVR
ncbi:MAG: M23 family metallopeptidase [Bacteroidales bacterium]|jgi:murein DD-endopeptidase MepM/ murein hydrolase activator NlpD